MNRPRLPRWLTKAAWIADAPADDVSSLDMLNGVRPPAAPMPVPLPTAAQAERICDWLTRACDVCGLLPEDGATVLAHMPDGTHSVTYGDDPTLHTTAAEAQPVDDEVAVAEFDAHVADALAIVSPWTAADRESAAAMGVAL